MPWRSGRVRDLSATGIPCSESDLIGPPMMPTPTELFLSLLISAIALLVLPYLVPAGPALVMLALLLMALPFLLGRR